ncbi:hypothetical protein ALC57_02581 [Trachymyrmex cornetzi]|uniref:Uncharacterized protein n=1 Tax=Trachymyrmex cornetzi TaxID=471704 RepID=A0A151JNC4_9HYME|nr:hypothetical protein ALC57_02581 [Trachymyrmex cornetzi]
MWNSRRVPARGEQIAYKAGTGRHVVRTQTGTQKKRRRIGRGQKGLAERAKMIGTRGKQEGIGNTSNAGQRVFSNEDKRAKRKKLKEEEEGERWCGIKIGSRARRRKKKERVSERKRRDEGGETNQRLVEPGTRVVLDSTNRYRRPPLGSGPIHRSGPGPSRARLARGSRDPCRYTLSLLSPPAPRTRRPPSHETSYANATVHGGHANDRPIIHAPPGTSTHFSRRKGETFGPAEYTLVDRVPGRRWSMDGKVDRIGPIFSYTNKDKLKFNAA